jgi:hypothetical protein
METDWFDVKSKLDAIFYELSQEIDGFSKDFEAEVRIADPRFGDFQVNGILGFAKKKKIPASSAQNSSTGHSGLKT